jgi:transcriptional regulator GlxA family with amidase domain
MQILAGVNDELASSGTAYSLTLLSEKRGAFKTNGGLRLVSDGDYSQLPHRIDTLMVAGGTEAVGLKNRELINTIRLGAKRARRVVAICTGTLLLAAAGLLANKRATTHWRSIPKLSRMFPDVKVEADALFVRHGNVWTSAGVSAGMDLALALVREDFGNDVALAVARRHVLFLIRPGGQSQFSAHLSAEAISGSRLENVCRWIVDNPGQHLNVDELASRAHMSARNLARVFRKETGKTPARFIEDVRIDEARRLLTSTSRPIAQIAAVVGFTSEERFRRSFQRRLKVSPSAYRERFT